jgi:PKD repeat protein
MTWTLVHAHPYTCDGVVTDTLTRTHYITVSQPLVAGFSAAPLTGTVPLTVTLISMRG